MKTTNRSRRRALLTSAAAPAIALALWAGSAAAQEPARTFAIAPQPLADALLQLSRQADIDIVASTDLTRGRVAPKVAGEMTTADAMSALLAGSGLIAAPSGTGYVITRASAPQSGSAAGDGADAGTVQALVVTAQKREENIQDVPIAMSAFTQEDLTRSQVAGGPDLMTQIPNMTFTKTNFSSYSIQIRGIGTQAISATTDPAVAVAFNNTPFVRNRFFEQEFYDLQRVEVLRGPQGTLYGRNATAGVVNLISAKPTFHFEAKASADVANYNSTRLEGMVNIPLVEDVVALRIAGAWTKRNGYAENQLTGNPIDGRDLWSTRVSLRFAPIDRLSANLIWEHFEEDDDRLRSGKQVCKKDPGPSKIGDLDVPNEGGNVFAVTAYTSQGCLPASMYAEESYQTPNGYALPFYGPTSNLTNAVFGDLDPYASATQSRDLRVIESMVDPEYRANTDTVQLQIDVDLSPTLKLTSESAYSMDSLFSLQDYNRFNTKPGVWNGPSTREGGSLTLGPNGYIFCDPQIGCSDRLMLVDLSTARSQHFSQEFRLSSSVDGPFNFSLGANFLRYDTEDKYYVFINSLSLFTTAPGTELNTPYVPNVDDNMACQPRPYRLGDPTAQHGVISCVYMDPNPIGSLNDQGRNYFLSKNPYRLISYAAFGEVYYNFTDNLKLTTGLRWTVDKKHAPSIPSWLLATGVTGEYPVAEVIDQKWSEPTGRVTLDWKPDLTFTEETLLYASLAHGYKAGGANPPPPVISTYAGFDASTVDILHYQPKTFDPEFVNAIEVGAKNTLLDGRLTMNLGAFFYDYEGYQISQIIDRSAVNLNFDAKVWGLEIETDWRPIENLRLGFKGGYENTRMADGSQAIDTMDRTAGHTDWIVVKPFPTIPSNCIIPVYVATQGGMINIRPGFYNASPNGICVDTYYSGNDPLTQLPYKADPTIFSGGVTYDGYIGFDPKSAPNGGAGFFKDLGGNELPNAPHFTATITADYTLLLPHDWLATLHTDLYYQSEAWTRVFNTEGYDKLKAYSNINLAAIFTNEDAGWTVMAYVKNVLNKDSITGAFLNSDDTGLTTNVFLTEPRLYGLRVTKAWTGDSPLGLFGQRRQGPYPFLVELGASTNRFQADTEAFAPPFTETFAPSLPFPLGVQDKSLDWGDQREMRLTYAPGDWRISAGWRYGKADGGGREEHDEQLPGRTLTHPSGDKYNPGPQNYGVSTVHDAEEHDIAEFAVGKEFGLGLIGEGGESMVSAGVRYARFESSSNVTVAGEPDWYFEDAPAKYPTEHYHDYVETLMSRRSFEGAGPMLSWEATKPLLGDGTTGRLGLDGSLSGGVLFGKQKMEGQGRRLAQYSHHPSTGGILPPLVTDTIDDEPISISRTRDVTVPAWGASLGLSYAVDRVKISAGYRWERYVDAIDGGVEEARRFNRGVDGPYLKLRFAFGR